MMHRLSVTACLTQIFVGFFFPLFHFKITASANNSVHSTRTDSARRKPSHAPPPPPSVPRTPTEAGSAKWKFLKFLGGQPFSSPAHWGANPMWDRSVWPRANVNWGEPIRQQKTADTRRTLGARCRRNNVTVMMEEVAKKQDVQGGCFARTV